MIDKRLSRAQLFFVELMIVIVFFAFAGAIFLHCFSSAQQLQKESEVLNGALMTTQSVAEVGRLLPLSELETGRTMFYYDENWQPTAEATAVYTLEAQTVLEQQPAGVLARSLYTVTGESGQIYQLETANYYTGGGKYAKAD